MSRADAGEKPSTKRAGADGFVQSFESERFRRARIFSPKLPPLKMIFSRLEHQRAAGTHLSRSGAGEPRVLPCCRARALYRACIINNRRNNCGPGSSRRTSVPPAPTPKERSQGTVHLSLAPQLFRVNLGRSSAVRRFSLLGGRRAGQRPGAQANGGSLRRIPRSQDKTRISRPNRSRICSSLKGRLDVNPRGRDWG